ncbi:NAD-dependent epimerase/dehydratase family protein [Chitinophaga oryziterrae]|uniref:NAD-dependent epimerase/dehydratase family protein n=1 Tax=Chitinophaga oryziterrae TaxID=1031224 RepID=A0A6N8JA31_9BACT|nr:NAD-dependent epimerase/dehydratase family protein [Chitinophaga oryziterrae]MVT42090.1 NAD-dependent epimerase/dehydratase family protein [Chitinophaga oryziterrae]
MNTLLTGASGFVGKNLSAYLLSEGMSITEVTRQSAGNNAITWEDIRQNVTDKTAYDVYIHLAGKAHDLKNVSAPEEYFLINTELTKQLFKHFLSSGAKDFIYFSSVKAAADAVDNILDEELVPNPQTPYGLSKLRAEEYLLSQPLPTDKRLVILRPCMIHGPGNKGNLNLLYGFIKRGIPYPLAAFDNRRSFLGIDNLLFVIREIIRNKDIPSGIYNVADDEGLSTKQLVKLIARAMNRSARVWYIPKGLLIAMAKIGDIGRLPLNSHRLQKLTESYMVSNGKLKRVLKVDRLPFSVEEGLSNTIKSFG